MFHGLTIEDEAQLFADFQRERRSITPYQRFHAELVAGSERAKAIDRIVREETFRLGDYDEPEKGQLKAVVALERIYDDDPARLRQVLRLARETWGNLPDATRERMLRAVWYFLQTTEDVDETRFIERLSGLTPTNLTQRAYNLREFKGATGSLPRHLAEAIQDQYRSKRKLAQ